MSESAHCIASTRIVTRPWHTYKRAKRVYRHRGTKTLQKLIWQIILRIRSCKAFQEGLKGFSGFHIISKEFPVETEEDKRYCSVAFDSHEFSVSKDHFPFKAIQITKKPPEWRTEAEIRYLRNRLLTLESFREYSPTLQYLLAEVIRFERFGRRRVIIRKGQEGSSFYFIFAGMVAITNDDDGSSAFVEVSPTLLGKGSSFGEVALLKGEKRTATVVCMGDAELLVVDKKDFFAYELDRQLHREFQARYNFLRKLEIFETWSNLMIERIADFCRIERFHLGQVITGDIGESSSIIFIAKGACDVLRQIDLSSCPSYHKWLSKQLCLRRSKNKCGIKKEKHRSYVSDIACVDRFQSTRWTSFAGKELAQLKASYACCPFSEGSIRESSVLSKPCKSILKVYSSARSASSEQQEEEEREVVQNVISGVVRTKSACYTPYGEIPASAAAAVYIRVDEVYKGDYLVNLQDNRPMILVSKGAELIRLKKEKLEAFADETTVVKLGQITTKYPSDDELCQVFLRQNSWELFKKDLLNSVMKPKLMKMVTPPDPCHAEEIAESWHLNEKGILDLTPLQGHKKLPPEACKYVPCHPKSINDFQLLPEIQPRLIHGINILRSSLNGVF